MAIAREHPDSFFVSLRPLLWLGQFCGVMPLAGTTGYHHSGLRFSWKNWQTVYTLFLFITTVYFNIISTYKNVSQGIHIDSFGWTMFYSVCNLNTIFFVGLARQLPTLCEKVFSVECHLSCYGFPKGSNISTKIFLGSIFALSVCEHSLLTHLNCIAAIEDARKYNVTFLESFFNIRFPIILSFVGYSPFMSVFVFLIHVIETVNWNYLDFFLATLSIQLSGKLQQFNRALRSSAIQISDPMMWSKLCDDYNRLSVLIKFIDNQISKLVFMSFISNTYHISLQLIRSLKFKGNAEEMTYFYFSLGYLILRMISVSFCGARIHEESRAPQLILYSINEPCPAVQRLIHQVTTDDVHFTGKRFFSLNRSFIAKLVGTLVTYEVILIQMNALKYNDPLNKSEMQE